MITIETNFLVVGGGSGGVATALSAARACPDRKVVLIEKNNILGGTSTICGVNNWEPGIGGMAGLHSEIANRILAIPHGAGTARGTHGATHDEPWGTSVTSSDYPYEDSLQRSGSPKGGTARFQFEPIAMARVMEELLYNAGV